MSVDIDPVIGTWYRHSDKGYEFVVVARDDDANTVELQHFDGDVEEIDLTTWYDLEVEPIEPPENFVGPMDDIEYDDLDYTETDMQESDWEEETTEWPSADRQQGNEED